MEKNTQPKAYLPDCDHGSCLLAATKPGGLLLLTGMLMRLVRDRKDVERVATSWGACRGGMATVILKEGGRLLCIRLH